MNEPIEKLFDQALEEFKAENKNATIVNPDPVQRDFVEKFAQLIVRECVKVMYDNAIERKVPPDINQTPTHYAIAVLEHFGVEE
jgi:hypothetical protein